MKFHLHNCYRTPSGVARISLIDFAGPVEAIHLGTHGETHRVMHDAEGRATTGTLKNPRAFDLGERVWPTPTVVEPERLTLCASAVRDAMTRMNVDALKAMADRDGPCDLTPFAILAEAALLASEPAA
jgi:hypothetical protein